MTNEGKQLDIALVNLLAGLRTVHVAAEWTRANLVLAHAAEECHFANKIAERITCRASAQKRTLVKNKREDAFVAEATRLKAMVILVIEVFPCKGLSHARGASQGNLENKDSILFRELTRIHKLVKRAAGTNSQ